jgi:hypothetical protein
MNSLAEQNSEPSEANIFRFAPVGIGDNFKYININP